MKIPHFAKQNAAGALGITAAHVICNDEMRVQFPQGPPQLNYGGVCWKNGVKALNSSTINKGMKIFVKAKPGAKEEGVEKIDDARFAVKVKEPPIGGRANAAIIEVLARYFNVERNRVRLVSGQTSRNKIVEIL